SFASMLAFRSGETRFICHSITLGFVFRKGDNYADTEGLLLPATPGAQTEVDLTAGYRPSRPHSNGFICPPDKLLAFLARCQSSSSVSP
ncbi:hypothetical protein, partial [Pectobacterium versatile]|uniref:hypothetical protein n=1 Tax=Pectobacterium versatile TaxID=2488639 RepID=UPI001CD08119